MAAKKTEDDRSLKRLGGGRWQTRDERFTIEPQSGTWVLVDAEQTDDLGLPLVRGPFRSLTEAKAAVEDARGMAAPESPLADRVKEARTRPAKTQAAASRESSVSTDAATSKAGLAPVKPATRHKTPEPPPEPRWITDLGPRERGRARRLIEQLGAAGVRDAEGVVRQDLTGGVPTVARIALANRLAELLAAAADDATLSEHAIARVAETLADGRDDGLDVRWRLVDGEGRPIGLTEKDIRAALDRRPNGAGKERKPGEERKPGKERNR
jgi:hypothetical protein